MGLESLEKIWKLIGYRYKSHPWHGIDIGKEAPEKIAAFIEVIPSDTVKYEVDKVSGYLKIDRPQKFSNIVPCMYGFIPQTYCAEQVAAFSTSKNGIKLTGDKDPLDICVLTEREVTHGNILVSAKPIGGLRMIDGGEADDKIIAILNSDEIYGAYNDVSELPQSLINRLTHYFLTYKQLPPEEPKCEITHIYGKEEALEVIRRSQADYDEHFGNLEDTLSVTLIDALNIGQKQQNLLNQID